ncbi:hypothetical protein AAFF_G00416970 [Aldrovandia affinis]|uniref:L27-1 domain-containing protein n=1 Tax=Aldrovandia affinis TaxID=143900 RepID=A0AAD7WJJ9_9TELE|nr:hypothetical protein AAFF_G00416970 [Aldrovandia affinis]
MPIRKKDTARALVLLEDYCSKLRRPEEQQLKTAILRVMGIFKSSLFQALLGRGTRPGHQAPLIGGDMSTLSRHAEIPSCESGFTAVIKPRLSREGRSLERADGSGPAAFPEGGLAGVPNLARSCLCPYRRRSEIGGAFRSSPPCL